MNSGESPWVVGPEPVKQTNVVTTQDRAKSEQKNMTAKFYTQWIKKTENGRLSKFITTVVWT